MMLVPFLIVLSGCFDSVDPFESPATCPPACNPPIVPALTLNQCIESRFPLELDRVVYDVPQGFETAPSTTSPQRVYVVMAECASVTMGEQDLGAVDLVQVGVFVTAPDRGQGGNADIFGLEIATSSEDLAALFAWQGFNVVNGTVSTQDLAALRQAKVQRDVDYTMQAQIVPIGNGPALTSPPIEGSVAQHSLLNWYQDDRVCTQYIGTSTVEFTASKGALAAAMPPLRPLHGTASMAISCDSRIWFGNSTSDSI